MLMIIHKTAIDLEAHRFTEMGVLGSKETFEVSSYVRQSLEHNPVTEMPAFKKKVVF